LHQPIGKGLLWTLLAALRTPKAGSVGNVSEPDEDRIHSRAELLPEEEASGSDDAEEQARIVLEDSDRRIADPEGTRRESSQTPD
jgi:hypothetical protein